MNKKPVSKSKWSAQAHPDGTFDFESLTAAQKEEFYQECEKIGPDTPSEELTRAQKQQHQRILGRGRPRIGLGSQRTQLTFERGLLRAVDRFAKVRGLTRSRLVSDALRAYLQRVA